MTLHDEKVEGTPLLIKVMEKGKTLHKLPSLEQIRNSALQNLSKLPEKYKQLRKAPRYPVALSPNLKKILKELSRIFILAKNSSL